MADYSPPTLSDLWASVGRDLTDPNNNVFNTTQLTDYINGGISEVNRVRALETQITIPYDGTNDILPLDSIAIDHPFIVELLGPDGQQRYIPHVKSGATTQDGWDYFAQTLALGPYWNAVATMLCRDESYVVRLWGYRDRDPLLNDMDVAEFTDQNEEQAVRLFCRLEAYRALNSDRSLFQQWQQQANNSDVSPTQLNGMLTTAEGSFDRMQKRLFIPRRIAAN